MVIENSFTASIVPNLLPALSKPIKTIFHRGRMRFASQFERTHEISIFQRLPGRREQNPFSRVQNSEISTETSHAPNSETLVDPECIRHSRHHSTIGDSFFPCFPASEARSVLSRSDVLRGVRHQLVGLSRRFLRCGVELRRAEPLPLTSPYPVSSGPRFDPGSKISQAHHWLWACWPLSPSPQSGIDRIPRGYTPSE